MDRRPFLIVAAALALLLAGGASAASAASVLVKFRGGVERPVAARILAAQGARQLRRIEGIGVRVVTVPGARERGALAALARDPKVLFAEPDAVAKPQETVPNDPYFPRGSYSISSGAWGWYQTHTTQAWT